MPLYSPTPSGNPTPQTTTSTGTQNDFSLTGGRYTHLRCNNATALVITGFTIAGAAPQAGDMAIIENVGTSTVRVAHQDAGSTAVNRALGQSVRGQILGVGGRLTVIYDGTTSRWRMALGDPGAPIAIAFSAGDFTTTSAGSTLTVASGDVSTHTYQQFGSIVEIALTVNTATISGAVATSLSIALPNGFIGKTGLTQVASFARLFDSASWAPAVTVTLSTATTWLVLYPNGTAIPVATDLINWQGSFRLQVD